MTFEQKMAVAFGLMLAGTAVLVWAVRRAPKPTGHGRLWAMNCAQACGCYDPTAHRFGEEHQEVRR